MEAALLIGVDTNVLVRLVVEDDPIQATRAEVFLNTLSSRDPGYVSLIVLCEFAWVLVRAYHRTREEVAEAVDLLLQMPTLEIERASVAQQALQQFRISRADFGDCCIGVLAQTSGCDYTVTFDKFAARLPSMRLLETKP